MPGWSYKGRVLARAGAPARGSCGCFLGEHALELVGGPGINHITSVVLNYFPLDVWEALGHLSLGGQGGCRQEQKVIVLEVERATDPKRARARG